MCCIQYVYEVSRCERAGLCVIAKYCLGWNCNFVQNLYMSYIDMRFIESNSYVINSAVRRDVSSYDTCVFKIFLKHLICVKNVFI